MAYFTRVVIPALLVCTGAAGSAAAQDLLISNARILDGSGGEIENGSIVVRDGRIDSVVAGRARAPSGARRINARGRTVMPGFIDSHRHVVTGEPEQWLANDAEGQMQDFLAAGFTTVFDTPSNPL